ncbi:MAG: CRTAC1 family protein, partial [Planctomycetaceae bacterium]|nr:CRTAC1 family protein [Planctomycetaceae bacterium]
SANLRLAFLNGAVGRRWEAGPYFFRLIREGTASLQQLALFGDLERPHEQSEFLQKCAAAFPADALTKLGIAQNLIYEGNQAEGQQRLEFVVSSHPQLLSGQALLGELILANAPHHFVQWHSELPPEAGTHPDIWYVRGLWFRRQQKKDAAVRCFWEAVRIAPVHRRAYYQLSQLLSSYDNADGEAAEVFAGRAGQLIDLTQAIDDVLRSEGRREDSVRRVARLMRDMGRLWEAAAWCRLSSRLHPQSAWPYEMYGQIRGHLHPETPQTIPESDLAVRFDFSDRQLPDPLIIEEDGLTFDRQPTESAASVCRISFEDQAESAGIHFVYNNGDIDLNSPGARMFEQTGGGTAVADIDGDTWPDILFPQGGKWPKGSTVPTPDVSDGDRLFRNLRGLNFGSVSTPAIPAEIGFGQGAAVGDLDNDGFADVYVANIGRNALLRNNGDGTFSDVSAAAGLVHNDWTTSCLLTDLNADGVSDLFDVNYVTGPGVFELLCQGYGCSPKNFDGIPDRLLIGSGDGGYRHLPDATPTSESKGMGILAFCSEDPRRPDLFITNDQVPNYLLRNQPTGEYPFLNLAQEAFTRGLAYNEDGLSMACMGIAAGDADGDGSLDFFVTNFRNESNTLYLQDTSGMFVDTTKASGLAQAGYPFVGWGSQFLDADLDGDEDLVVVNGDVDDYSAAGGFYHMPPQLYRNQGTGTFETLAADKAGTWFEKSYLGRGLSRLDWNRDGRQDFVGSNINQPASLVTNNSATSAAWLTVRLHPATGVRDAIGTVLVLHTDAGSVTRHVCAGDGFMASNEQSVVFGLADSREIISLKVAWPSGATQTFSDIPGRNTVDLIEGRDRVYLTPR